MNILHTISWYDINIHFLNMYGSQWYHISVYIYIYIYDNSEYIPLTPWFSRYRYQYHPNSRSIFIRPLIPLVKGICIYHNLYGHPWEKTSRCWGADDRRDGARHSQARRHRPEARAQGGAWEKSGAAIAKVRETWNGEMGVKNGKEWLRMVIND